MSSEVATWFYRGPNRDEYLARIREDGAATPDVFWEASRHWAPYLALDISHGVRRISETEALSVVPGLTREALHAPAPDL